MSGSLVANGGKRTYPGRGSKTAFDPGCVKTLRGITAPGILGSTVMRRAKKRKNLSSARHYDQIRFRFHTAKTQTGHPGQIFAVMHNSCYSMW